LTEVEQSRTIADVPAVSAGRTPVQLSRQQILEATFDCLREDGYDATTIRRIAKRLGCAIGSIYRYFRDKRELLYVVTQELLQPVLTMIEHDGSVDKTEAMYASVAAHDGEAYRLMFWLACHTEPNDPARLPAAVRRIIDYWAGKLGSHEAAQTRWAALHGRIILGLIETQVEQAPQTAATPIERPETPIAADQSKPQVVIPPVDPSIIKSAGNNSAAGSDDVVML